MSNGASTDLATALLAHLLQNGLVKALRNANGLKDDEKIVPWFYQVLRNSVVDHVRNRSAATRRDEAWASSALADDDTEVQASDLCMLRTTPAYVEAEAR